MSVRELHSKKLRIIAGVISVHKVKMTSTVADIFRADFTKESRKMEIDYSSVCDEKVPLYKEMAAGGKFIEAIDGLLSLEKQTRTVYCNRLYGEANCRISVLIF